MRNLLFAATLAAAWLTMRIFPDCFLGEIIQIASKTTTPWTLDGPTAYGTFLLVARNVLCLLVTLMAGVLCFAKPQAAVSNGSQP